MQPVNTAAPRNPLAVLNGHSYSSIHPKVESFERPPNVRSGELLRWSLHKEASPFIIRAALITVVSLTIVFLLFRCFAHIRLGHSDRNPFRRLAEGWAWSTQGCSGEVKESEDGEDVLQPHSPVILPKYLLCDYKTEGHAINAGWGLQKLPETVANPILVVLKEMLEAAETCQKLMSRLAPKEAAKVLLHVSRVAAIDLACLSILPGRLQPARMRVYTAYFRLLKEAQRQHSAETRLSNTFSKLKRFFGSTKDPLVLDGNTQVLTYVKIMLTVAGLVTTSSSVLTTSLSRLLSQRKSKSARSLAALLEYELEVLDALRVCRAIQSTRKNPLGLHIRRRHREVGSWSAYSVDEVLGSENRDFDPLPEEVQRIHRAVASVKSRTFSAQQGDTALPLASSLATATSERQESVLQCFEMLGNLASAIDELKPALDPVAQVELVIQVTELAALDVSGFTVLPAELESHRNEVAQKFIWLASETLTGAARFNARNRVAALEDRLALLKEIQKLFTSGSSFLDEGQNKAMSEHVAKSLASVKNAMFFLNDLKILGERASMPLTCPEINFILDSLSDLVKSRLKEILRNEEASYSLTLAESRMRAPVFSREELRERQRPVSQYMAFGEMEELANYTRKSTTSLSHTLVPSQVLEGAAAATEGDRTHTSGPDPENWTPVGYANVGSARAAGSTTSRGFPQPHAPFGHLQGSDRVSSQQGLQAGEPQVFPGSPMSETQTQLLHQQSAGSAHDLQHARALTSFSELYAPSASLQGAVMGAPQQGLHSGGRLELPVVLIPAPQAQSLYQESAAASDHNLRANTLPGPPQLYAPLASLQGVIVGPPQYILQTGGYMGLPVIPTPTIQTHFFNQQLGAVSAQNIQHADMYTGLQRSHPAVPHDLGGSDVGGHQMLLAPSSHSGDMFSEQRRREEPQTLPHHPSGSSTSRMSSVTHEGAAAHSEELETRGGIKASADSTHDDSHTQVEGADMSIEEVERLLGDLLSMGPTQHDGKKHAKSP